MQTELIRNYPLCDRVVPVLLQRQAERYGARPFVVVGEQRWSFDDALIQAQTYAAQLRAAGVRAGDRVALHCSNRAEFLQIFLGCAWMGAVVVPINIASRGAQLQHILNNCGAQLLVTESEGLHALSGLIELGAEALAVRTIWWLPELTSTPTRAVADTPQIPQVPLLPSWQVTTMPSGLLARTEAAAIKPGDTLAILYTSGTTGPSKGVCCPHAQYFWWGVHTAQLLGLSEGEVLLTTLPLFHTNALNAVFQALLTGSTLVVETRFSVSAFWQQLERHAATVTYLLGAMVPMLLSKPVQPDERHHRTRIALAPGVPPQFHAPFTERFGLALLDGYGATESNFVIGAELSEQRPGTMGRVRPGFSARVVDANDQAVAAGTPGELVLRADEPFSFATGYFQMPEKTVEAWQNLWFHTGDRVVCDADGYYTFLDRIKDAIRRRGENISSYEVEQVLLSHPAIAVAAVFPVRSELAEDEVMAALVLRADAALEPTALMQFCETRMPYFAVPRYIDLVAELPCTESGKVQKYKLRERGVTATTWDREAAGYAIQRKLS